MGKQHSSSPGNRRPGRPDSAPQRGGKPFNSFGGDDRRPPRREDGSEFPSRPPFGRPAGGSKPGYGGSSRPSYGNRPAGGEQRFGGGDERRYERPRRAFDKPEEKDDAADFMRGRLNKPDFRKDERPERGEGRSFGGDRDRNDRGERPSFGRRFEGNDQERPRRSFDRDNRSERPGGFGASRPSFGGRPGGNKFGGEGRFERNDERPARRFEGGEGEARPPRGARGPGNAEGRSFGEKPFGRRFDGEQRPERGEGRSFGGDRERPARRFEGGDQNDRPVRRFEGGDQERPRRSFDRDNRSERPGGFGASNRFERGDRAERPAREERGGRPERFGREERPSFGRKPQRDTFASKPGLKKGSRDTRFGQSQEMSEAPSYKNLQYYEEDKTRGNKRRREEDDKDGSIRLNRYIANAGICSRREADVLIESGEIRVNGEVVTELGYKVQPSDTVHYGKTNLKREKQVYVLLNKPKDFLTTTEDPEGRKTVMDLVANASKERIFPVGRLDRNTTGLLLFTNDGEVAQKLSHPSHRNKKVYQVELDKDLTEDHLAQIAAGLELEDGKAEVDDVAVVAGNPKFVGVEIHIGRNRIVRRIFEHLGYEVKALDRVQYAGLTKKDLPRGNWRYLTEKEVIRLKYFM
ncbi:pseudouridine synthase [Hymenobacter gummosus]|uniref:Pseudouridine synthase n=1 Tax=Hymenobacter gummosus TaxID=1776032 RepID=A0A431U0I9_9BACT|nr:pseudouridine synthase [Hymenobacter gummosus]RTQ48394.1 pseudouridine synthase [Hymenobacter gummosus]